MKITKSQLTELIQGIVKKALKENAAVSPEQQLDDAVSILELISEKVMSFPLDNPQAVQSLPALTDALEQLDGKLGKIVGQLPTPVTEKNSAEENSHGGKIPLSMIQKKADGINSDYVIGILRAIKDAPFGYWSTVIGPEFSRAFKITFAGWTEADLTALYDLVKHKAVH